LDPVTIFPILGGFLCFGILMILIVIPFLGRFALWLEVSTLLAEALGSFFQRPGLVQIGCFVIILMILGCCCFVVALLVSGVTCFTNNPSGICRLFGR
jgi:hypothetical protein